MCGSIMMLIALEVLTWRVEWFWDEGLILLARRKQILRASLLFLKLFWTENNIFSFHPLHLEIFSEDEGWWLRTSRYINIKIDLLWKGCQLSTQQLPITYRIAKHTISFVFHDIFLTISCIRISCEKDYFQVTHILLLRWNLFIFLLSFCIHVNIW